MQIICEQCNKPFEGRRGAKTCSDLCRAAKSRALKQRGEIAIVAGNEIEDLLHWCNIAGCTVRDVLRYLTDPKEPKPGSGNWKIKYGKV